MQTTVKRIPHANTVQPGALVLALSGTEKKDYILGVAVLLILAVGAGVLVGKRLKK